jgi:hypothetical protein
MIQISILKPVEMSFDALEKFKGFENRRIVVAKAFRRSVRTPDGTSAPSLWSAISSGS